MITARRLHLRGDQRTELARGEFSNGRERRQTFVIRQQDSRDKKVKIAISLNLYLLSRL